MSWEYNIYRFDFFSFLVWPLGVYFHRAFSRPFPFPTKLWWKFVEISLGSVSCSFFKYLLSRKLPRSRNTTMKSFIDDNMSRNRVSDLSISPSRHSIHSFTGLDSSSTPFLRFPQSDTFGDVSSRDRDFKDNYQPKRLRFRSNGRDNEGAESPRGGLCTNRASSFQSSPLRGVSPNQYQHSPAGRDDGETEDRHHHARAGNRMATASFDDNDRGGEMFDPFNTGADAVLIADLQRAAADDGAYIPSFRLSLM